jgi:hypothetical protein
MINQARTRDEVRAGWGDEEFGGEERSGHKNLPLMIDYIELMVNLKYL